MMPFLHIDIVGSYTVVSLLVSLCVVFLTKHLWQRWYETTSGGKLPPGSMGWPVIGETHMLLAKVDKYFNQRIRKYGTLFKSHVLGFPEIYVCESKYLTTLAPKEPFQLVSDLPIPVQVAFGPQAIGITNGNQHAKLKKFLLTSLTPTRLDDYLPYIQALMQSHILAWSQQDLTLCFTSCEELMCDIVLEVVLGWKRERDSGGKVRDAFKVVNENMLSFPLPIPGLGFSKLIAARKVIEDFIKKRMASKADMEFTCVLEVMMNETVMSRRSKTDEYLTDDEIVDNCMNFLVAGSGTTVIALANLLLQLWQHPEKLAKLRQELEDMGLLNADSQGVPLTYSLLQSLSYCNCLCKEILRVAPPVGQLSRKTTTDLQVGGCVVPKGWGIKHLISKIHDNSLEFENKDQFLPERWLDSTLEERLFKDKPYNYIPFGIGARICLGKTLALTEMAMFLVEVARLVDWQLHESAKSMPSTKAWLVEENVPMTFTRRS